MELDNARHEYKAAMLYIHCYTECFIILVCTRAAGGATGVTTHLSAFCGSQRAVSHLGSLVPPEEMILRPCSIYTEHVQCTHDRPSIRSNVFFLGNMEDLSGSKVTPNGVVFCWSIGARSSLGPLEDLLGYQYNAARGNITSLTYT